MEALKKKEIEGLPRYQMQNANLAIRDIFDGAIELVTNVDDRYSFFNVKGRIEIEVERRRKGQPNIFRVRDFADGMNAADMDQKLSKRGGTVSGFEKGKKVRGTNSRGAKDIAALGDVTFESIKDEQYHKCSIHRTTLTPYKSIPATEKIRKELRIPEGTGTVVTLTCNPSIQMPQHENLVERLSRLVSLRDIVGSPDRTIVVRDMNSDREDTLKFPQVAATERLKETFSIPDYDGAEAKLTIKRAERPFEKEKSSFRLGGIIIKSRHAVHEATLFDPQLEHDQYAAHFVGRLTCPYLDDLWNEYDERTAQDLELSPMNPCPVLDPSRRSGLIKEHPFVKALFAEVLKRLRPLVEEERKRAEHERATIENKATRQRLNKLEQAASKFIDDERDEDEEPSREPGAQGYSRKLREAGFTLNPPFRQFVKGEHIRCWLTVNQEAFPEIEVGASVQIECHSDEIRSDCRTAPLEPHATQEGLLLASWNVSAAEKTPATGMAVTVGPIRAEATFEVFETEKDKYAHVKTFEFSSKRYRIPSDGRKKKIKIYCPIELAPTPITLEICCSSKRIVAGGSMQMIPRANLGISVCEFTVSSKEADSIGSLTAEGGGYRASAEVFTQPPKGVGIKIKIEDVDLGNQRYRWRHNVLELAAKHPSLRRYLGTASEEFKGQNSQHFRLLIAEIVAEAVCAKVVSDRERRLEYEDEDPDWNFYYAEYSRLMTAFLPIAHKLQVPDGQPSS
jgi:hypothetical protein